MPKVTLIINPVKNERLEFNSNAKSLGLLIGDLIQKNPELHNLFKDDNISIRINGKKINKVLDQPLLPSDSIIIIPEISNYYTYLYMAIAGKQIANNQIAATVLAAWGGNYLGAIRAALPHAPAMSGFTDGSPGSNSPTYGWDVKAMYDEGIPIAIPYGTNKVGGNILSSMIESKITPVYDWFAPSDAGCSRMFYPLGPFPYFNAGVMGVWPPVRGVYAKLNSNVWLYGIITLKLFTFGDLKKLIQLLINHELLDGNDDFDTAVAIINEGVNNFLSRKKILDTGGVLNSFQTKIRDIINRLRNESTESFISQHLNVTDLLEFSRYDIAANDFGEVTATGTDKIRRQKIKDWFLDNINRINAVADIDFVQPILAGTDWHKIFDSNVDTIENLGCYLMGAVIFLPEAYTPQWWVSDVKGLTTFEGGINVGKLNLDTPYQLDYSEEQSLHQIIGLGEGECEGIEKLFINDNPIDAYGGTSFGFLPGTNDQSFSSSISILEELDEFNKNAVSYSRNTELVKGGEYAEFITDPVFPANNVTIRAEYQAYRLSVKGEITPLGDDLAIKVMIVSGFEWSNFDYINIVDNEVSENEKLLGRFLTYTFTVYGGQTESFLRSYRAFPFLSVAGRNIAEILHLFPKGAEGAAALLTDEPLIVLNPINGLTEEVNWVLYAADTLLTPTGYKQAVYDALTELYNDIFVKNQTRIKVRIIRLSPHVDNIRYFDKMTVKGFDEVSYAGWNYPNLALLGVSMRATDKLNGSAPKITAIFKGLKIKVPALILKGIARQTVDGTPDGIPIGQTADDGFGVYINVPHEHAWFDEDIGRYRSKLHGGKQCLYFMPGEDGWNRTDGTGTQRWTEEYCENPIWCLYDFMTKPRYGLGNYISLADINITQFMRMAEHCDELVPDGTARWATDLYQDVGNDGTAWILKDEDTDYFQKEMMYYDDSTKTWLQNLGESLTDKDFYLYKKSLVGECVFAVKSTNPDGSKNWTRAVIEDAERHIGIDELSTPYTTLNLGRQYNTADGFWTNGIPDSVSEGERVQYQLSEKRFRLNVYMDDSTTATDRIKQICDMFRCYAIWINGAVKPVIDKPATSVAVIGMGNILKDSLNIGYSSINEIPNLIKCQFHNKELYYEKDTRQVIDPDIDIIYETDITKTLREKSMKLLGITHPPLLLREIRYRLLAAKYQNKSISFKSSIENIAINAGDVFEFTHDILKAKGLSGRILGFDASTSEIILDQDVSSLIAEETVKIELKHTVPATADEDAVEYVGEYVVTSITGNRIKAPSCVLTPSKFDNYAIGGVGSITEKYRVVSTQPDANNDIEFIANLYDERVYGNKRLLLTGGYTYYDDTSIAAQDNRITLLPTLSQVSPVSNLVLSKANTEARIKVAFDYPLNLSYIQARIELKVGEGKYDISNPVFVRKPGKVGYVGDNLPLNTILNVRVFAEYAKGLTSLPAEAQIEIINGIGGTGGEDPNLIPDIIKNIRLGQISRPVSTWGGGNTNTEYFTTPSILVKWDRGSFQGSNNLWKVGTQYISHYVVTTSALLKNGKWTSRKAKELNFFNNSMWVDYEDLGLNSISDIKNVVSFGIEIYSVANTAEIGLPSNATFKPYGPNKPTKAFAFGMWSGVYVWWKREDDWQDIDEFEVWVDVSYSGVNVYQTEHVITTMTSCFIKIPLDVRQDKFPGVLKDIFPNLKLGNPLGIMLGAEFRATIKAYTLYGAKEITVLSEPDSDSYPQGSGTEPPINDNIIDPILTNIDVYDNSKTLFTEPKWIDWSRLEINVEHTYAERFSLIDGYNGTGITYNVGSGLLKKVVRITYGSPIEKEFLKIALTVDTICKVWIEFEQRENDGTFAVYQFSYFGGTASNGLSGGLMVRYEGNTAISATRWLEVAAGEHVLEFPEVLKARFVRLVVQPLNQNTVKISEVRFREVGTFDELYVDYLSAITADMGTLTAGMIEVHDDPGGYIYVGKDSVSGNTGIWGKDASGTLTFWINAEDGTTSFNPDSGGNPTVIIDAPSAADSVIKVIGDGKGIVIGTAITEDITISGTDGIKLITADARIEVDNGKINVNAANGIALTTEGAMTISVAKSLKVTTGGSIDIASGSIDISSTGAVNIDTGGALNLSGASITIESDTTLDIETDKLLTIDGGSIEIGSSSTTEIVLTTDSITIDTQSFSVVGLNEFTVNSGGSFHIKNEGHVTLGGTASNPRFDFDIVNAMFTVGDGSDAIEIAGDGGNASYIQSSNFQSSILPGQGRGFRINANGNLEANDVLLRGALRSSAFVYDEISAVGGRFFVSKTATLDRATDIYSGEIFVAHDPGFTSGEYLFFKEGVNQEVMQVTNILPSGEYEVNRNIPYTATMTTADVTENCTSLDGWTHGVSVTQVTYDGRSCFKVDSSMTASKTFSPTPNDINFVAEITLYNNNLTAGEYIEFTIGNSNVALAVRLAVDYVWVYDGTDWNVVGTLTCPTGAPWQTWLFDVRAGTPASATCDIYKNSVLQASGIDCSWLTAIYDGKFSLANSGSHYYHVDQMRYGSFDAFTNYSWEKGTALVSYGVDATDGFIMMDSESANTPFIDIIQRTSPDFWDNIETKIRLGRLDGINDADFTIGSGEFGLYGDNVYLKGKIVVDSAQGITIKSGGDLRLTDGATEGVAGQLTWYDGATKKASMWGETGNVHLDAGSAGTGSLEIGSTREWLRIYLQATKGVNMSPQTGDPTSPTEGDVYYNTTSHVLKVYDGSTWQTIATV